VGSNKASWPFWAPASLVQVYEKLSRESDAEWKRQEFPEIGLLELAQSRDYPSVFVGIGNKKDSLAKVRCLCMDRRMQSAWKRIQKAIEEPGIGAVFLGGSLDLDLVAAHVAQRVVSLMDAELMEGPSRAMWIRVHKDIAERARLLADLLDGESTFFTDLNRLCKDSFADDEWSDMCEELGYETAAENLPKPSGSLDDLIKGADKPLDPAAEAKFESDAKEWSGWYDWKLHKTLELASVSGVLRKLDLHASAAASSPPFASKGSDDDKRVARLSIALFTLFANVFGQPLDEVVATIVEVVTGQEVSAGSVKMRRKRLREFYWGASR
jgi:hypothetical protein